MITTNLANEGQFTPVKTLLVYRKMPVSDPYSGRTSSPEFYVSLHNIRDGVVCEGHPVSKKDVYELCRLAMPGIDTVVKYIPENILSYAPFSKYSAMVWWIPAARKSMFFNIKGLQSGIAPIPATLFAVIKDRLYVWALKTDTRPTLTTPVYFPPYFNVFKDGTCMGNIQVPKTVDPQETILWEDMFFGSDFTNESPPDLKRLTGEELWGNLINTRKKFPAFCLKKWGTLNDVLSKLEVKQTI
jgi:PRTRC genetic system protein B